MVNKQDPKRHFPRPELKREWDCIVTGLTEWSFLEEPGCLSAVPPRLFVLECLGHMKSSLFLLKTTVAHRRIKSSKWGMAYERIAITSFQNIFWGKKATRSEVYLRVQLFGQGQRRFHSQGLSHYAACRCQAQEQCHTSLTPTRGAAGRAEPSAQKKKPEHSGTCCSASPPQQEFTEASEALRHSY